jgi:hypothetical protein
MVVHRLWQQPKPGPVVLFRAGPARKCPALYNHLLDVAAVGIEGGVVGDGGEWRHAGLRHEPGAPTTSCRPPPRAKYACRWPPPRAVHPLRGGLEGASAAAAGVGAGRGREEKRREAACSVPVSWRRGWGGVQRMGGGGITVGGGGGGCQGLRETRAAAVVCSRLGLGGGFGCLYMMGGTSGPLPGRPVNCVPGQAAQRAGVPARAQAR